MSNSSSTNNTSLYLWTIGSAVAISAAAYYFFNKRSRKFQLDPEQWQKFQLVERLPVSTNTSIFRFKLPNPEDALNLPIGRHLHIRAFVDGTEVIRSYTPISLPDEKGFFELLVKVYPTGTVSKYISGLKIGEWLECRGPKGKFQYHPNLVQNLGMIAGGTGITPMLQVIKAILRNPADQTRISLIFANLTEADILLKKELDELALKHPQKFQVHYIVNEVKSDAHSWTGSVGFVTPDVISKHLPSPAENLKILICGPPPMNKAMAGHLDALGYGALKTPCETSDIVFKF